MYRLDRILLNGTLVGCSEEHQPRSSGSAGFRLRQSQTTPLLAADHQHSLHLQVSSQEAHDAVQHRLLWDKPEFVGAGTRLSGAIRSLCPSRTLSMHVAGAAG